MASFKGRGSMSNQNVLVTVPNSYTVRSGKDGQQFTNLAAELSVLPGHNENRAPQTDTRLTRKFYKDPEGNTKQSATAPYDLEVLDKLKDCPSAPATDKDGNVYGRIYSVEADLMPAMSKGKSYGVKMKTDSIKPGPEIPEDAQELQFQAAQEDRARAKEAKAAEAQAETPAAEQEIDQPEV